MADSETTPPATNGAQKARPEKPDEAKFKADVAKAEKEHEAAQARFVWTRFALLMRTHSNHPSASCQEQVRHCSTRKVLSCE